MIEFTRRGAAPATAAQPPRPPRSPPTAAQALRDREEVVSVGLRCAGQGCLECSGATAPLCRMRAPRPTWCTGVRTHPFAAHTWVEAERQLVGEGHPMGHFKTLMSIPPLERNR
ncbi:lasso peptide biosynthesis B2 protein [Streptomyces massasporeus]|uniref:lasso peptide biosynthesis B2 protein n=1 Tax=Streptomyces massasporeus TaxID=67324 RepID=UPI0036F75B02